MENIKESSEIALDIVVFYIFQIVNGWTVKIEMDHLEISLDIL